MALSLASAQMRGVQLQRTITEWSLRAFGLFALFTATQCTSEASDPIAPAPQPSPSSSGGGSDAGVDAASSSSPDVVAPSVTAMTPANGAKAIRADVAPTVTFSEPMDRASVEASYSSTDLPAANVAFSWNAAGDVLTIAPATPLEIVKAADASTPARRYTFTIGTTAKDAAGNALAKASTSEFFTAREHFHSAPLVPSMSGLLVTNAAPSFAASPANYRAGDGLVNTALWSFFTFDLKAIPAGATVTLAELQTRQVAVVATPFADLGGKVDLSHVVYATADAAVMKAAPATVIAPLSTDAALGPRKVDVSSTVRGDLAERVARGDRAQFRASFVSATDSDAAVDAADFLPAELGITFLAE